jgi:actin related protein 2/3 complex, subunit 3
MPAYHSALGPASAAAPTAAGVPLLPLKGGARGPAPPAADDAGDDIVDDALALFRANVLFRSFEIQAPADLLLVYLTLFIQQALRRLDAARPGTPAEATALLRTLATTDGVQPVPGGAGWPLDGIFPAPAKGDEAGACGAGAAGGRAGVRGGRTGCQRGLQEEVAGGCPPRKPCGSHVCT